MALKIIASMCTGCSACEPECPNVAIREKGGTFIIDYYPVKMIPTDFVLVGATVFFVSILAAWIPSRKPAAQSFSLKS